MLAVGGCLCLLHLVVSGTKLPDEHDLLQKLFNNQSYDSSVRPVYNSSHNVVVTFGFTLIQIMDMDEKNQVLITNAWLEMIWKDERIHWNKKDYNNLEVVRLPAKLLWLPDIVLYNKEFEVPRLTAQIQKQFDNLKAKARGYLDEQRNPPTGGGPSISPSPSVQLIITRLGDKPNMIGLATGIDTESPQETASTSQENYSASIYIKTQPVFPLFGCSANTQLDGSQEDDTTGSSCATKGASETTSEMPHPPKRSCPVPSASDVQAEASTSLAKTDDEGSKKGMKRRKKSRCELSATQAEDDWLIVEKERATMETKKLEKEIELLELKAQHEKELFHLKKEVLKAKLNYYTSK